MKATIKYLHKFVGTFLIFLGTLFIFIVNRITRTEGEPSKYNKDKSIGLFIFNYNYENGIRDCKEIVRGRISSKGDVYIFPFPESQTKDPVHESFHTPKDGKLSKFHLVTKGFPKRAPMLGTEDLPTALKFAYFKARMPSCFCFRRGKRLKDEEIKPLVEKLIRYVPPVDSKEVIFELKSRGIYQARRKI